MINNTIFCLFPKTLSQMIPVLLLNVWIFNKQLHLFL